VRRTSEFLPGVFDEHGDSMAGSVKEWGNNGIENRVQPFDGLYDRFSELGSAKNAISQLAGLIHGARPPDLFHHKSISPSRRL
jgi:hypothetical protein